MLTTLSAFQPLRLPVLFRPYYFREGP